MHPSLAGLLKRSRSLKEHVVVTDGEDPRVVRAAAAVAAKSAILLTLLGHQGEVARIAAAEGVPLACRVRTPGEDGALEGFARLFRERQARLGRPVPSLKDARALVASPSRFGALMVTSGEAGAMLGGAAVPTAQVLSAALSCIGLAPGRPLASGAFAMLLKTPLAGGQRTLVFADAAVVPQPSAQQLVFIAENSVDTARAVLGLEPKVAFLSFSTKGSASHPDVLKVQQAAGLLQSRHPDWVADGELQADAALVPQIARKKAPGSPLSGDANVLIFPDLDAANIAYKLVERTAGAQALGVLLSGFERPVHDLSRGCSEQDIVHMICAAALGSALRRQGTPGATGVGEACNEKKEA